MFSWFRKKQAPAIAAPPPPPPPPPTPTAPPAQQDPPRLVRGQIGFSNGEKSWTEHFDVIEIAVAVLNERGIFTTRDGNTLTLDTSGYVISPVMTSFKPLDRGGAQTVTVIQVRHPTIAPQGLFEYQHATGKSVSDAIRAGFDQWTQVDLVALLDATEQKPQRCMALEMSFPATGSAPARHRRVILGPVAHFKQRQPAPDDPAEEHPFCPCCLFTRSMEAFKPFIESDDFVGLRLFAMRDEHGEPAADCRVNGQEFEAGKQKLREYVRSWPDFGTEFRKQYVLIQSRPKPSDATAEWRQA
jgi:hypothetical protein